MSIVFFDTETGGIGIDAARNWSIVQLGAVIWPDSLNQSVFECVINEELAGYPLLLHPEATEVTGFTPERIREKGVHPSVAATKFLRWLWEHFPEACAGKEKINLGGHNVGYDTQFLARLFRIAGLIDIYDEIFNYRATDTASIARFLIDSGIVPLQKADSKGLFDHFGCAPAIPHDALSDAYATACLYSRMRSLIVVGEPAPTPILPNFNLGNCTEPADRY